MQDGGEVGWVRDGGEVGWVQDGGEVGWVRDGGEVGWVRDGGEVGWVRDGGHVVDAGSVCGAVVPQQAFQASERSAQQERSRQNSRVLKQNV